MKDFIIAHTIFGADGIVLDIKVNRTATPHMDCNYWSCYVHEDERLLIGGMSSLKFETIRNIAQSENYTQFVKVLNILDKMVKGISLGDIKPRSDDVVSLRQMINFEIGVCDNNEHHIPAYIQKLFHHFVMKKTEIIINLLVWEDHFIAYYKDYDMNVYGYKKFRKLLGYDNSEWMIDFILFVKLFSNLEVFTIWKSVVGGVKPSMQLSHDFAEKILECIEFVNKSSKSLSFCRFEIVKPS